MARRAIWRGAVSFGMVAIPIKLYAATDSKDLNFVTLHSTCHSRIRQKRYCPHHDAEVEQAEIVRGYEYAKDQYVVMEESNFENLPVPSTHVIEITQFVDLADIDPINFERSYMLEPDGVGVKPFYLLKQSLESSRRVAIAKVSLRQKEHICCLRPYQTAMAMHTMHYPDEIRGTHELELPEERTAITEQEMGMATMLIDQLTRPYDASGFQDEYRLALERIIEGKLTSQEPVKAAPAAPKGKVTDLMEALRASIAAAKKGASVSEATPEEQPRPKGRRQGTKARPG
jgi:DNA end-binding protein Ku